MLAEKYDTGEKQNVKLRKIWVFVSCILEFKQLSSMNLKIFQKHLNDSK